MAISLIGTPQTGNTTNGANVTLTFSTAPSQDDYVVVFGGHGATVTTLSAPGSGYTQLAIHTGSTPIWGAWYKKMGSTPDTSVVCSGGGNAADGVAYCSFVLRGVDTSTFLAASVVTAGPTTSTNPDCPNITDTVYDGAWVLALAGSDVADASITVPSGYSNLVQASGNDNLDISTAGATLSKATHGAENPGSFTTWSSGTWYAITVAVNPGSKSLTPTVGSLTLSGNAPAVVQSTVITPAAGSLSFSGAAPSLIRGTVVTANEAALKTAHLVCDAVNFDGSTYATRGAGLNGAVDSKKLTITLWLDAADNVNGQNIFQSSSGNPFSIEIANVSGKFQIIGRNSSGTTVLTSNSTHAVTVGTNQCWMFSCDMGNASNRSLYNGDTDEGNFGTYVDDTIDFTFTDWAVGASTSGSAKLSASLAELRVYFGTYVDFSVEANRRLIFSATGEPVDPVVATEVLGTPIVFLHRGEGEAVSEFLVNDGTGGSFTTAAGSLGNGTNPAVTPQGQLPKVVTGTLITPTTGTLSFTGVAPVVFNPTSLTVLAGALTLTGVAPAAVQSTLRTPTVGALTLTGVAPAAVQSNVTAPTVGALTLTGVAPVVIADTAITPSAGTLALTGAAPTVEVGGGASLTPDQGSLTLSGVAPAVVQSTVITPSVGALALSGVAPAILRGTIAAPTAGALTLSGVAPAVVQSAVITPSVGSLVLSSVAPAVVSGLRITPTAGALTLTGVAPVVVFGIRLTPTVGALTLSGVAPAVVSGQNITPTAGALLFSGVAPSVLRGTLIEPTVGALSLIGFAPDVQQSQSGVLVTPDSGTLFMTGVAPDLEQTAYVSTAGVYGIGRINAALVWDKINTTQHPVWTPVDREAA